MHRNRPFVNLLLGAIIALQGFAVAASPRAAAPAAAPAAEQSSPPPCHGAAVGSPEQGRSCCDDSCPVMTACLLGHLGVAPVVAPLLSPPVAPPPQLAVVAAGPPPLRSFLRPPIVLPG